jgi:hypothetical protein
MTVKTLRSALAIIGLGLVFAAPANAGFGTYVSGNGTAGTTDTAVTFVAGPQTGAFVGPLPFGSATTPAYVVTPNNNWTATIAGAQWDSINPAANQYQGSTALYAINVGTFTAAQIAGGISLTGLVSADDTVGGIYVNGTQVVGQLTNTYTSAASVSVGNISSLLTTTGPNILYVYDINQNAGSASGVLFSLTLTSVPEPSSIIMVGLAGLVGVGLKVRRKRSIA